MANWTPACDAADLADGEKRCLSIDDTPVVISRVGDAVYALHNECPHAGLPLGDGDLTGLVLTCPYHGYAYNVKSGKNIDWPDEEPPATTYPTKVEDGRVYVLIETADERR